MPPPKGYKLDTPSNIPEGYTLDAPTPQPVASHTQARTPGNYAGAVGGGLAEGAKDFVSGTYGTLRHPIETGKSLAKQLDEFFQTPEDEASWQGNLLKAAEKFPVVGGYVQQAETGGTTPGSPEALRAGVRASTALAVGPKTAELITKAGPRAITESVKSGLRKTGEAVKSMTGLTPSATKKLAKTVSTENISGAKRSAKEIATHHEQALDAAHETRGKEVQYEAEKRAADEKEREEASFKNKEEERKADEAYYKAKAHLQSG